MFLIGDIISAVIC